MSILIHRWPEGSEARNGINWDWDPASQPRIGIRFWRLMFYYRRRSAYIMKGNPGGRRHIFEWDYGYPLRFGGIWYDFYTKSFVFGNRAVTQERLAEFIESEGHLVNTTSTR